VLNDDTKRALKIGGVMENFPSNSHLQYDFLMTLTDVELWPGEQPSWRSSNYPIYLKLRPGTDPVAFEKKLTSDILDNYILPSMKEAGDKRADEIKKNASLHLQSISDIYLGSYDFDGNIIKNNGDIRIIKLFGFVAIFILIIACINFINLSTAKSANRAKEVGLRKVLGSLRLSLIKQFLTESLLFSFISFILGLLIAWSMLPYFNKLADKSLTIPWNQWWLIPTMLAAASVIGIIAGLYPSFYLSSFRPISVLKGQVSRGSKSSYLRNGLVVFQFATSIILIIGTVVISKQTQFILNKKLGFDKDQVVLIQGTNTIGENVINFRNELSKIPAVKNASISDYLPIEGSKRNGNSFYIEGTTKEVAGVGGQNWVVDDHYIPTMGMKLVAGRNFSRDRAGDSMAVIINQTMANKLQLKDPVGKRITNGWQLFDVVGVVEDFNFQSMKRNIEPIVLRVGISPSITSVKVTGSNMKQTIASINEVWKTFAPSQPIRYTFLDESYANMYANIQRMGIIFSCFAVLAIIIACLGLFALSAFMAEQRNKEIGIRKVLGASMSNIATMLSGDFVKLVIIAIIIATPIAWWGMNKWLQDYAYRINLSWWMFLLAGVTVILIALITISFQVLKSATTNPVKSLRSE
jgi:putative ABC transport system permease protein